jgi:hypothetical protein
VLQAKPLMIEAGAKGRTVEFTLAVRSLIQVKTPGPAGDSEPAVARISRKLVFPAPPAGFLPRRWRRPESWAPHIHAAMRSPMAFCILAVSWGSQPSRRAGASLSAPRALRIAPRAIRRGVAPEVVGVKKNR